MGDTVGRISMPPTGRLTLVHGDLTQEQVDAIVNAANRQFKHGGGVAAAILKAGGESIRAESERWIQRHGPIDHDQPAITGAGDLPCQAVIHVVGPRWGEGREDTKLATAVQAVLEAAESQGFRTIAMPPISTGIFGFPVKRAAGVILAAIRDFYSDRQASQVAEVRVVIIDRPTLDAFQEVLAPHFDSPAEGG